MMRRGEYVPIQRAGKAAWYLRHGESFTTAQAASMCGVTPQTAARMLREIAKTLPIIHDREGLYIPARGGSFWLAVAHTTVAPPKSSARQRAAWVAWMLASGVEVTTTWTAQQLGCSWDTAYRILCLLSAVLPIYQDERGGAWRIFTGDE